MATHERRERQRHPFFGGVMLKPRTEPQHVTSWAKGAEGERRVAKGLDALASDTVRVLHDRRLPRRRANIDHLVIAPSGVYVIDAKNYTGQIERRVKRTFLRSDVRLYVKNRDRSNLIEGMDWQCEAVRQATGDGVPIRPALCFAGGTFGCFSGSFKVDGVLVGGPRALSRRIKARGPLSSEQVAEIAACLASRLPPA